MQKRRHATARQFMLNLEFSIRRALYEQLAPNTLLHPVRWADDFC